MKNVVKNKYILIVVLISVMLSPIAAVSNETVDNVIYRSDVDQDYGFYRVIDYTAHKPVQYDSNTKTLTINVGDTVEWVNDATPDEPLTIISKDDLWGNRSAYLRWNYQKFGYTFNESGTYQVYIKEYPRGQHQTIVVKDISGTTKIISTPTITSTPIKIISTPTITSTTTPIINRTDNLSNVSTTKSKPKSADIIPIEAIVVVAVIMILAIYIIRSRKK